MSIPCPTCGDTGWKRVVSGNYSAEEWVETDQELPLIEEEDINTDRMDATDWECGNGHTATDEVDDLLAEIEG